MCCSHEESKKPTPLPDVKKTGETSAIAEEAPTAGGETGAKSTGGSWLFVPLPKYDAAVPRRLSSSIALGQPAEKILQSGGASGMNDYLEEHPESAVRIQVSGSCKT